jgi:hypothetical protein
MFSGDNFFAFDHRDRLSQEQQSRGPQVGASRLRLDPSTLGEKGGPRGRMQLVPTSSNGTFRRNRAQTIFDFNQGNRTLDAVEAMLPDFRFALKDKLRFYDRPMIFFSVSMARKPKANPSEVVKAFRRAAKDLGCLQSEQRFQDALFVIGRHKPTKQPGKRRPSRKVVPPR